MKNLTFFVSLSFLAAVLFSCKKSNVEKPVKSSGSQLDTSNAVIANRELVGDWNVVTDSVSVSGKTYMYTGVQTDHYVFTKFANLYINCGFNKYIDTGIYTIGPIGQLSWQNLWGGVLGMYGNEKSFSGGYIITSVTAHSLILTSNTIPPAVGPRFELIILKK